MRALTSPPPRMWYPSCSRFGVVLLLCSSRGGGTVAIRSNRRLWLDCLVTLLLTDLRLSGHNWLVCKVNVRRLVGLPLSVWYLVNLVRAPRYSLSECCMIEVDEPGVDHNPYPFVVVSHSHRGVHPPLRPWCIFPPVSDFPHNFWKIFGLSGKFLQFYLIPKNFLTFIRQNFWWPFF